MTDKKHVVNIKGKEYKTAAGRVADFRADHPDWALRSDLISMDSDTILFKVTVLNNEGIILSAAHGSAPRNAQPDTRGNMPTWVGREAEKAETAALARALAWLGYGDIEDDSDYLADTPKEKKTPEQTVKAERPLSPDDLVNSLRKAAQAELDKTASAIVGVKSQDAQNLAILMGKYLKIEDTRHAFLYDVFGAESSKELSVAQYKALNRWITSDPGFVMQEVENWLLTLPAEV